jgi:hypothetical protein
MSTESLTSFDSYETMNRLRDEMGGARVLYESAREAYNQAKKQSLYPSGKGLACATVLHDFSRENYRIALGRFRAFILTGELPERASAQI